jgi:hypothetical protein
VAVLANTAAPANAAAVNGAVGAQNSISDGPLSVTGSVPATFVLTELAPGTLFDVYCATVSGDIGAAITGVKTHPMVLVTAAIGPVAMASAGSVSSAFVDTNADGLMDLFVVNGAGIPNQLFPSTGSSFGDDVAPAAGLDDSSAAADFAWGDVNGDGMIDLVVANVGATN